MCMLFLGEIIEFSRQYRHTYNESGSPLFATSAVSQRGTLVPPPTASVSYSMRLLILAPVVIIAVSATPVSDLFKRTPLCRGLLSQQYCSPGYSMCCGSGERAGDIYVRGNVGGTAYDKKYCPGGTVCQQHDQGIIACV